jgi:predicted Zn-dependent peptidase
MKTHRYLKSITVWAAVLAVWLPAAAQRHPRELSAPAPLKFTPPKPAEFVLNNGLRVFYLEDRELPLVYVSGVLKLGNIYEPVEKAGLSSLTGTVLRTGGTKTLSGDDINEELEFLAATIEASIGAESGSVSANCQRKDLQRVLELYADIVMNPEFRQDKIELAKNQQLESIRRRWDMPMQAGFLLFGEKIFGADHPSGRRVSPKTLAAISRQDLVDYHARYFAPNNMMIGVCGDLSQAEAKSMLAAVFKGWKKKEVRFPAVPALVERADGAVYYARKDTPQANVFLGHLGVRRLNPDEYKLELMNYILGGGGFTARLMKELRSNRGLTYGIYGGVMEDRDRGMFVISSPLKAEKCVEALGLIKEIVKDLQVNPVSEEEIAEAKNATINSFVFRFQQRNQILAQYLGLKRLGYPPDYLDRYIDNIRKVTKADIQEVAKKYMDPDKMIVLVVGDEKRFDKPLSAFGKVVTIELDKIVAAERAESK